MKNKNDILNELRNNKIMQHVLSLAKDEDERRRIKAHAEGFALKLYKQMYEPVAKAKEKDPDVVMKSLQEIKQTLINSGSIGKTDDGGK